MTKGAASNTIRGMALALAGFALLSAGDGIIKGIAGSWPGTAVAALRYALGAIGLGILLAWREGAAGFGLPRPGLQLARAAAVSFATVCFFLAIFAMPLAEATTIQFSNPLLVVLLSVVFLGERPAAIVWGAILLAFAGVFVVLRPNLAEIGIAGVLPLLAALGMAALIHLNRMAGGSGSILQMQFWISALATPLLIAAALAGDASGLAALQLSWPPVDVIVRCAVVAVSASMAHMLIYAATLKASPSDTAPMVYVQLIVALVIGAAFFGEAIDLVAIAGSAMVIAGGLILWWHQRNRHARLPLPPSAG